MKQNIEQNKTELLVGEKILIATGVVKFGTRPGLLDRWLLKEKDVRRMVYNGKNIELESQEYQELCRRAYREFEGFYGAETSAKLQEIGKIYDSLRRGVEERDKIQWFEVFAKSLLLGDTVIKSAININKNPQITGLDLSDIAIDSKQSLLVQESQLSAPEFTQRSDDSFFSTTAQTVGDVLNWLSARSNNIPYGMLFVASRMANLPSSASAALGIASIFSSTSKTAAVMVGDKDYKTTAYCGSDTSCKLTREQAEKKGVELYEVDKNQVINSVNNKTKRIVLNAHGDENNMLQFVGRERIRPDDFAAKYFPNAEIIHATGCYLGLNFKRKFKKNSLKPNQILFVHAGSDEVPLATMNDVLSYLTIEDGSPLPPTEDLHIIFKKDASSAIFTGATNPFSKIQEAIKEMLTSEKVETDAVVETIYNIIADNTQKQKNLILDKLKDIPEESQNIIVAELERVGFRDYTQETDPEVKTQFVRDYLSTMVMKYQFCRMPKAATFLEKLITADLVNINYATNDGTTLAMHAASDGFESILEVLIRHKVNLDQLSGNGENAVLRAIYKNHPEILKLLIKGNANLNHLSDSGVSAIMLAVNQNSAEFLKLLIEGNANVNLTNEQGFSAVYLAAQIGSVPMLKMLYEAGANIDQPAQDGYTPLIMATMSEHNDVVQFLVGKGAHTDLCFNGGSDATTIAVQRGNIELVKSLLKGKPDLNKDMSGNTPPLFSALHFNRISKDPAQKKLYREIALLLVMHGADPELAIKSDTSFINAYDIISDQKFAREMKDIRKEYIKNNKAAKNNNSEKEVPSTSIKSDDAKKFRSNTREL